jgi:hypothetical protein
MRKTALPLLLTLALAALATADSTTPSGTQRDPFLDSLTGTWTGTYVMGTVNLPIRAEVQWALNDAFLRAENSTPLPTGGMFLQNEYWLKTGEKTYALWFFDSYGNAGHCNVDRTPDGYVLTGPQCAKPPLGTFRNKSVIKSPDEIEYTIEAGPNADGSWMPVAGGTYRREKKP